MKKKNLCLFTAVAAAMTLAETSAIDGADADCLAKAENNIKLDVVHFEKPVAIQYLGPFDWTSKPKEAQNPCKNTKLGTRQSFREMNPDGMLLIGYFSTMPSFPTGANKGDAYPTDGVWFLLRKEKMFARFVWRPISNRKVPRLSYEAALFLYPANPNLTHMRSPAAVLESPIAVLTIENDTASPAPFFCAFTPESHLNFGPCQRPKTAHEAARFFFEFLCEHPQGEVYCLGKDEWRDNADIRKSFERATFEAKQKATGDISPEDVLKEIKPQIDKVKAESRAMAKKYDMVLWPDANDVSAGADSGARDGNATAFVNGVRVDGATPGEWTHDWDAATAATKKDGKPIFVNFTGSDWCGWCKLLRRQVFTQPEWCAWASNNVYLVHIDFPNDKELVPEKYRERNKDLSRRYSVGGYPTCYLLNSATLEPLGRFGASRDITASAFIEKVAAAMPSGKPGAGKTEPSAAPSEPPPPKPLKPTEGVVPVDKSVFNIKNGILLGMKPSDAEEIVVPEGVKTVCIDGLVHGLVKTLTIPEGVEAISRNSGGYYPGARIETVRLPASVVNIRATAFDGHWRRLRTIEVAPGSPYAMRDGCLVDTRDDSLVFALPGRERIVVSDSVKTLGDWSFNANDAREIVIPEGVVKICRSTFKDCCSLEILSLPASLEEIGKDAFANCGKLSRIDVSPDNSRYGVRDGFLLDRKTGTLLRAFGPLVRISIPEDVKAIGEKAFSFLDSLVSVTVPDSVKRIEDGAFAYCKNLEELNLPERLDFYDSHFIMGCGKLAEIRLPAGLETVHGNYSFGKCSSLRELVFPEGLKSIGGGGLGAVCECENLERIFIPSSVTKISGGTFSGNPKLNAIDAHPDNSAFCSKDGVLFSKDMTRLVRCPEAKAGIYEVPGMVNQIDALAFSDCRALTEIRIPEGVAEIGYGAFKSCPAKTNRVAATSGATKMD